MADLLGDIAGSLLGTTRLNQNQQIITTEQQRIAANQQLIAQQANQQTMSSSVIFGIIAGFILLAGLGFYFVFKK